jgi:hypothetical protein
LGYEVGVAIVPQYDITHPHKRGDIQWLRVWHRRKWPRRSLQRQWWKNAPTKLPRKEADTAVASVILPEARFPAPIDVRQQQATHVDGYAPGFLPALLI